MDANAERSGPSAPVDEAAMKDRALAATEEGITIADARLPDNPLIYANAGFERLTGYPVDSILGRNCRFLQGAGTDPAALDEIRAAIREERACTVELLNYRKDGTLFWNRLSITPIRDDSGDVTHFIGVQSDITDRRLAEEALSRANRQLEAANRRMVVDLEAAARIQRAHLPDALPKVRGANLAWMLRPCDELAGDTLNVVPLDDEHIGLYVLDVSGHGVPAALLSVTMNHWLSPEHLLAGGAEGGVLSPADVAAQLNRRFPMDPETAQYFTLLYGVFNTRTRTLRYVTAGHPAPIAVPRGTSSSLLNATGVPVGLLPESNYTEHVLTMEPGDRLYMYSDGVVEARNSGEQEFETERLVRALDDGRRLQLEESVKSTMAAVEMWARPSKLQDDATILALEIA